nr:MAG TPA: hypothetical protein [Caudoviricetes sp.]
MVLHPKSCDSVCIELVYYNIKWEHRDIHLYSP